MEIEADIGATSVFGFVPPKVKALRKPRPSELAAKAAKKKVVKPKAKKKVKPGKSKAKKPTRKAAKKSKVKRLVERTERLDMRITKAQKIKLNKKAAKSKRTVTSLVLEAIDRFK